MYTLVRKISVNTPSHAPNPFDDLAVAQRYEAWYAGPGRHADLLEKALLAKLLRGFPGARSIVEIGCGTGHFTRWLAQSGWHAVGVDVSAAMLQEARRLGGAQYLTGDALALPLADRSYDLAALITTLEFVSDPALALAQAMRVARRGLLLGVLNRWSWHALRYRLSGSATWRAARFFGPVELAALVKQAAGNRFSSITWRTTLWPIAGMRDLTLPWGGFIGMAVELREADRP